MPQERFEGGQADLTALRPYLQAVENVAKKVEALRDIRPNATNHMTARWTDQNQTAGHRPYMGAYSHLSNAFEHSAALWSLIEGEHGMSPRVPWTLLRSIFESGFWATWMLDSPHSITRRRRGLVLDMADWREREAWVRSLPMSKSVKKQASRDSSVYEQECQELGIDFPASPRRPSIVDELRNLAIYQRVEGNAGQLFESTWRNLSGLQHGHAWALYTTSKRESRVRTVGGFTLKVTADEKAFDLLARASYGLVLEGAQLFERRSTQPA